MKIDDIAIALIANLPPLPSTAGPASGMVALNPVSGDILASSESRKPYEEYFDRLQNRTIQHLSVRSQLGIRNLLIALVDATVPREIPSDTNPVLLAYVYRFRDGSAALHLVYGHLPN